METTPGRGLTAAYAAELKGARVAADLSIDQAVAKSGVSRSTLIRIEGAKTDITMKHIDALTRAYDIEPAELMRRAQLRLSRS